MRQQTNDWITAAVKGLAAVDEVSMNYIQSRRVRIGFGKQGAQTGAIWTLGNRIYLNGKYYSTETDPLDAHVQSLLVHEVCHLQQGFFTALSVYGELQAWQLGFRTYQMLTGLAHHPRISELMSLPLGWDRDVLQQARVLMLAYAGKGYRADLLPLYPLGREIKYWLGLPVPT